MEYQAEPREYQAQRYLFQPSLHTDQLHDQHHINDVRNAEPRQNYHNRQSTHQQHSEVKNHISHWNYNSIIASKRRQDKIIEPIHLFTSFRWNLFMQTIQVEGGANKIGDDLSEDNTTTKIRTFSRLPLMKARVERTIIKTGKRTYWITQEVYLECSIFHKIVRQSWNFLPIALGNGTQIFLSILPFFER